MNYLVRIGTQTIGPMSREDLLRHAPKWQSGSLAASVAPAGTQNFVPLAQFIAGAQAVNPSPAPPANFPPPPPAFGQLPHQPNPAQPLPVNTQTPHQPWSQTPPQPQTPLPWQQPAASRTASTSKSSTPFVALAIGGAAVLIVALLLIGGLLHQRKQAELAQQVIGAQQQEEEKKRQGLEEQQRKTDEAQQAELQRQQDAARQAEAMAALDDADTALQAVENEARSAPGDFSDDFRRLRSAVVEARQLVSQGDYRSGQENAAASRRKFSRRAPGLPERLTLRALTKRSAAP